MTLSVSIIRREIHRQRRHEEDGGIIKEEATARRQGRQQEEEAAGCEGEEAAGSDTILIYVEPKICLSKRALVERGDTPIYIATYRLCSHRCGIH